MLISAAIATLKGLSALQTAREGLSVESRLSIIGDGAAGLAAGYLLVGDVDKLRILSAESDSAKAKSKVLPKFIEVIGRSDQYRTELIDAPFFRGNVYVPVGASHSEHAGGVVVSAPVTEYGALVGRFASIFAHGQAVLLVNAPMGAGLQFAEQLRQAKIDRQVNILELGSFFDYADIADGILKIYGVREKVSVCGNSRNESRRALTSTTGFSKALVPTSNLLERGLGEVERLVRPILLLFGLLGGRTSDLNDLSHVVNPQLITLISSFEAEIKTLCRAYRLSTRTFLETLTELSAVDWIEADCLDQALIALGPTLLSQFRADSDITEATALALCALKKDVSETLVLISEFARMARVQMPVLDSIIALSEIVTRCELSKSARGLADLGLFGLDASELLELINA